MNHVSEMISTHPNDPPFDSEALATCIAACLDCAASCTTCADACLGEDDPASLARCIRLNQDCADVCAATGRVLARQLEPDLQLLGALLQTCAQACAVCAAECDRHAGHHEHCRVCAEACRACEEACRTLIGELGDRSARPDTTGPIAPM